MMFLIKFCGKRPKRTLDSVESAKYDEKKNSTCTYSFMTFLLSWIGIFPFRGSGFSADPDPDAGKKVRSGSRKKPGSETLIISLSYYFLGFIWFRVNMIGKDTQLCFGPYCVLKNCDKKMSYQNVTCTVYNLIKNALICPGDTFKRLLIGVKHSHIVIFQIFK